MSENQFAMVSEWMVNGDINQFVKTHRDANRFKLVRSRSYDMPYLSLMESFLIARRRRSRVDVYAQSGDDTRRPEGGMVLDISDYTAI